jgi:hypothetical protein
MDARIRNIGPITTEPLFDIVVDLHPKLNFGTGPLGMRVLFGSAGGTFEGPKLRGTVLPVGGDWATFRADGAMLLDVRLGLQTSEGDLIHMTYGGRWIVPLAQRDALADAKTRHLVDPASYYFRTHPVFETGSARYAWLNDVVCIGSGYLVEGGVAYKVFQVL